MIAANGLRWLLTLMFAAPVLYGLWRLVRTATGLTGRVGHVLHAAMGVLMIAMAWPWGMDLAVVPQVVLFTAGALWFVAASLIRPGERSRTGAVKAAWPHVLMMGAMAWMVAAMGTSGAMAGHGGGTGHGGHEGHAAAGSGLASMSLTGMGPSVASALLAVALTAIGLVWLAQAFDLARVQAPSPAGGPAPDGADTTAALDPACHAVMALGMAVMFALFA
ncbi:DUF5134 domain-containing protein [Streptomyces sp. SID5910]|uniref:DUF5134 domain-containing protein n=1 Tax=Streptomyces sp. SID5910 TaxID=2690312 RepID=UPI001368E012|nr:DUF5134 domain-containing protein [Streptomyces sp. SID5910]MYR45877.1 DUF5134 domain-containing protein [Streptomyces sp. SID5910]